MSRTSVSHPLRIDVATTAEGGQIGMTLCPGRRDRLSVDGPWDRDLDADLELIAAWRPSLVITLVEDAEFALLGVPAFGEAVLQKGLRWRHVPLPDAGVPDAAFELAWRSVGAEARTVLRNGGRLLLHCRAGLGRTGMIAARLLVELGESPADAIAKVRAARSGTIETAAQERHVRACRALGRPPTDDQLRDRIRGSLLGAAVGDALGSAFEFVSSAMIEREIGTNVVRAYRDALPGSLLAPRSAGIPTDDTAMTLALVDALVVPGSRTPRELLSCMVSALQRGSGRFSAMFWNGGPGGACIAMMRAAQGGAAPFEGLNPQAGGNGAAMRAHPCGAFADRAFVADLSAMQARLSHPHPGAVASAQVVALVVHEAIYEGRLATAVPPEITDRSMLAAWERAHEGLERGPRLPPHLLDADMAGWNTVATAHAIAQLYADQPDVAIGMAAASGRDTDTVASIVGGMLGALYGAAMLPADWITGLQGRTLIEDAAEALYHAVGTPAAEVVSHA